MVRTRIVRVSSRGELGDCVVAGSSQICRAVPMTTFDPAVQQLSALVNFKRGGSSWVLTIYL